MLLTKFAALSHMNPIWCRDPQGHNAVALLMIFLQISVVCKNVGGTVGSVSMVELVPIVTIGSRAFAFIFFLRTTNDDRLQPIADIGSRAFAQNLMNVVNLAERDRRKAVLGTYKREIGQNGPENLYSAGDPPMIFYFNGLVQRSARNHITGDHYCQGRDGPDIFHNGPGDPDIKL